MLKKWIPLWAIPTLIIFAVGTVWLRLFIVRTTYTVSEVDRSIARSRQDMEVLQLKASTLRSPTRLGTLAETQFKLFQPKIDQVVRIKRVENTANEPRF